MTNEDPPESTPLPGAEVHPSIADEVIHRMHLVFRDKNKDINAIVPTACVLKGATESPNALDKSDFLRLKEVYFYSEKDQSLRESSPKDIRKYYKNKNPWEYIDACVFDKSMTWCIGLTHHDYITYTESERVQK